jgi:hypothetical protein
MKKSTLFATLLTAAMAMPAFAQEAPVKINGSLIDWYYWGKDYTGSTSGEGWNQQPAGGGAWIDENGVAHPTGEPNYGLLSLTLDPSAMKPLLPEFLIRNTVLYSNCGGLYMGGNAYYSFFSHEAGFGENMEGEYGSEEYEILVRKWTWDGVDEETGLYKNVKYQQVGKMYNQPTDLTYDPENDIVYGIFNIGVGDGYKLGTLDMKTFKITWISREAAPMTGELRTLACNSKGELYGTDKSGNICHVDKTDGKITVIGNMGFKSQQKMMSATFDYRTDKMYWLGFVNDGKKSADTSGTNNTLTIAEGGRDTGLYEIDVETGKATLIGKTDFVDVEMVYDETGVPVDAKVNKYGKMQMTGIYVEGSIVKYENDLNVRITNYPQQLKEGESGNVQVTVKNMGTAKVRGKFYSVSLYADGELIGTIDEDGDEVYTDNLEAGDTQAFTFGITAPAKAGDFVLKAVVTFDADERLTNNTAEATVNVLPGKIQQVLTLVKEEEEEDGYLEMSWNKIDGSVTDGAEDYVAFSYDNLSDWTMVDGDGGYTQKPSNFNASVEYPNWNTPKAFIVMNPMKAGLGPDYNIGGEKLMPHSGDQYFAGFFSASRDGAEIDNDDYMVSPTLNGEAQTISFWAKGYRGYESPDYPEYVTSMSFNETLEVLYTTDADNLDPTTYLVAKEEFTINDKEWEQYTADLPAGAKHFALHRTSKAREIQDSEFGEVDVPGTGSFIMMIDDITFFVSQPATGYNIYCNGEVIEANFQDEYYIIQGGAKSGDTYWVTALDADSNEFLVSNKIVYEVGENINMDVNNDGLVNALDIQAVINACVANSTDPRYDINKDGLVNALDIQRVINAAAAAVRRAMGLQE